MHKKKRLSLTVSFILSLNHVRNGQIRCQSCTHIYVTCFSSLRTSDRSFRLTCRHISASESYATKLYEMWMPGTLFWSTCQLSLIYFALLKLYEGKTFLDLSHHMFTETNIVPTAKASKTKLPLAMLHVFTLQREWIRRFVQHTYVQNAQPQDSNHKVRLYKRVSKNGSRFHWFPVICKLLISPGLFWKTKI
jgi:hypothetical protein